MSIRHHIPDLGSSINRGTIGWWVVDTDFAANPSFGGNVLYDTSNFRRPMALTNMDPATDWIIADGRRCLDFDGSNDYATGRCTLQGSGGFAVATWVRIATNQTGYIVSLPNAAPGNGVDIYLNSTNSIRCWANTSGGNSGITGTYTYAGAGWLRIVSTYDGANHKLYVNGGEVQTGAKTGTVNTSLGEINVGDFGTGFSDPAACQIAEVRVWNRGLSATEVWQDYRRWMDFHQQYTRRRARRRSSSVVTGTFNVTQGADTLSASGLVTVAGSASITEGADTLAATAAATVTGSASIAQAGDSLSATAVVTVDGAASIPQAADTLSAAGTVDVAGASTVTQGANTLSGAGTVVVSGSASITQGGNTLTAGDAGGITRGVFQSRIFQSHIFGGSRG